MKKNFIYALMSAIAFVGAAGITACSSSDEIIDNPDYNPETNSVKTSITLSVNPANANANSGAGTRQPSSIVQSAGNFRGMTDMILVPSTGVISANTLLAKKIPLADFVTGDYNSESKNYKLYTDKDVAIGVDNFLFLGKAIGTTTSLANKFENGYTVNNFGTISTKVEAVSVTPQTIASTTDSWATQTAALVTYLNSIATATGWSTTGNSGLRSMYNKFIRTTATAGSANAILLTMQKLYREVQTYASTDASAVVTAIQNAIVASTLKLKDNTSGNTAELEWNSSTVNNTFPTDLGLPEGAAQYKYGTSSFEYITDGNNATSTPVEKFIFPNELYYLTSTPILTTTSATPAWPATAADWRTSVWSGWDTSVGGGTKNIALKYNIQYGSALLDTQVKCAAATLYDNARAMDETNPAKNNAITLDETKKIKLTGVIVGSQPSQVGWNYLPVSNATYTYALYDLVTTPVVIGTTFSDPNYTLVFDNYKSGATGTDLDVKICLEFLNDAEDFYGKDGIILKGHKFYLVGKLKVSEASSNPLTGIVDETVRSFFPNKDLRAYIQDYTTTAQFTITAGSEDGTSDGSLSQAVSTVPDLRATSQTIGLSVDLTWRPGLTFNANLGE